ncbi:TetR/AcrR family transcriptional regulator [Goodfellowiella coeruleoviolacea]|uniref:Transcriptional regulator, TetR family n=1 Tax=Goodfellowiella coeruleoviolacea TaxID=334858 RepID=A0AAE3KHE2_9PSEU|nr:TetR/AcrR family transcriptional regulator [Goodfellowiella coeruleoviolacea]MCP2167210.1 transcriptional regulator, TetR family [Goodfellowiella coeruleoviolacea]
MARRRLTREESREQTRERLLTAAAELFAERGVNGASVEQIAERAGYSRGAFYGNFEDKHELVVALLTRRTLAERAELSALREHPEPFTALRAWHRDRAEHLTEWLALRTELMLYALRNPEIRPRVAEGEAIARDAHTRGIAHAFAERGRTPPADPAFLALIVHALGDGLLIQRLLFPDEIGDEVVADAAELLIRGWLGTATPTQDPTAQDPTAQDPTARDRTDQD